MAAEKIKRVTERHSETRFRYKQSIMNQQILKLATYNIHRCIGTDGRFDPDRTISVLKELDADVIALQEVETRYDSGFDLLNDFRKETGMHAVPGPTMYSEISDYGNALLSTYEINDLLRIDISVQDREPRGALSFTIDAGDKKIHVVATHLGLSAGERIKQAELLLKVIKNRQADVSVLMGDLNEWFYFSSTLRRLGKHFIHKGCSLTFPSHFPLLSLDKILVDTRSIIQKQTAVKNSLTKAASDHLPLRAEIII